MEGLHGSAELYGYISARTVISTDKTNLYKKKKEKVETVERGRGRKMK